MCCFPWGQVPGSRATGAPRRGQGGPGTGRRQRGNEQLVGRRVSPRLPTDAQRGSGMAKGQSSGAGAAAAASSSPAQHRRHLQPPGHGPPGCAAPPTNISQGQGWGWLCADGAARIALGAKRGKGRPARNARGKKTWCCGRFRFAPRQMRPSGTRLPTIHFRHGSRA